MDEPPAPRMIAADWNLVRRRTNRPRLWIPILVVLLLATTSLAGFLWSDRAAATDRFTRHVEFERVYLIEGRVEGNLTQFRLVVWFTNPSPERSKPIEIVAYAMPASRNVAVAETSLAIGILRAEQSGNASFALRLPQDSYRIELLLLENGRILQVGHGRLGIVWTEEAASGSTAALTASDFQFEDG